MRCVYMFVFVWEQTVIPELETAASERTRAFVSWLQESRGFCAAFYVLKYDDSSFFKIFFFCLFVLCYSVLSTSSIKVLFKFTLHETMSLYKTKKKV